jgi:hypothetical protein
MQNRLLASTFEDWDVGRGLIDEEAEVLFWLVVEGSMVVPFM